ncbi:hypothetical protein CPB86DRAFT_692433 [Serendipita vermifera]|nr:hypothetical protein CPB86DRAFT_692433 [Serendipita vermifera]
MASAPSSNRAFSLRSAGPRRQRAEPITPMVVRLTEQEAKICTLLDEFCQSRNKDAPDEDPLVCRIAGGWVRDKLLGVDSHDIDIALNTMTGEEFAQKLLDAGKIPSVGVTIASNPEQSKHLATTRLKILGVEVDLVNLRSETYSSESRIPVIEFGSPQRDAERRDLTINALFYNTHTREIEDFTGKGIEDLQAGRVRTPLVPKATFEDDPLRILRCVRFASRLAFDVDERIAEAARDKGIQAVLATKISRERIGEEMDKMMQGRPDPLYAIQLLHDFGLLSSIFIASPIALETATEKRQSLDLSAKGVASLHLLLSPESTGYDLPALDPSLLETTKNQKSTRARLYLAAALTPFRGIKFEQKKKTVPLVDNVIREGLKLGSQNHYLDGIPQLFNAAEEITAGFPDPLEGNDRAEIATLLRHTSIHNSVTGSEWSSSLLFALSQELIECWEEDVLNEQKAKTLIEKYNTLAKTIHSLGIADAVVAAPLLDGKAICKCLEISAGPHVGKIRDKVLHWQLGNPSATVEECQGWLREAAGRGEFGDLTKVVSSSKNGNGGGRKKRKVVENEDPPTAGPAPQE